MIALAGRPLRSVAFQCAPLLNTVMLFARCTSSALPARHHNGDVRVARIKPVNGQVLGVSLLLINQRRRVRLGQLLRLHEDTKAKGGPCQGVVRVGIRLSEDTCAPTDEDKRCDDTGAQFHLAALRFLRGLVRVQHIGDGFEFFLLGRVLSASDELVRALQKPGVCVLGFRRAVWLWAWALIPRLARRRATVAPGKDF